MFTYEYNEKEYNVRKGVFKNIVPENIDIFVNPNNPEECEIYRIKDRIK